MTYQQLFKRVLPLPAMMAVSLFCPRLMLAGGVVGIIAGIIFFSYLITIYLYTIKLHKKLRQIVREAEAQQ